MKLTIQNESDLQKFATLFGKTIQPGDIFLLSGEMGAGKTTFVRYLCESLGMNGIASPTFTLVNQYQDPQNRYLIYHIDLYRTNATTDLYSLDIERYLTNPKAITFIEWAEKLDFLKPDHFMQVDITYISQDQRTLSIIYQKDRYNSLYESIRLKY